jgi:hypothetical protein
MIGSGALGGMVPYAFDEARRSGSSFSFVLQNVQPGHTTWTSISTTIDMLSISTSVKTS